jgi:hypothetical protein
MLRIFVCPSVTPGSCSLVPLDSSTPCRSYLLAPAQFSNTLKKGKDGSNADSPKSAGINKVLRAPSSSHTILLCCQPCITQVQIVHLPYSTVAWFFWDLRVTSTSNELPLQTPAHREHSSCCSRQDALPLLCKDIKALLWVKEQFQLAQNLWIHRAVKTVAWVACPLAPSCNLPHVLYPALLSVSSVFLRVYEPEKATEAATQKGDMQGGTALKELVRIAGAVLSVAGGNLMAPALERHWPLLTESVVCAVFSKSHDLLDWCVLHKCHTPAYRCC